MLDFDTDFAPPARVIGRLPGIALLLASVTEPPFHTSLPGRSVNGTGDGSNRLTFDRSGEHLIGAGNLPLGFAGGDPDSKHWMGFQVTLFGLKH